MWSAQLKDILETSDDRTRNSIVYQILQFLDQS